jgi:hypothetical protein
MDLDNFTAGVFLLYIFVKPDFVCITVRESDWAWTVIVMIDANRKN